MDKAEQFDVRRVIGSKLGYTSRRWRAAVDIMLHPFGLTEASWLPLLYISRGKVPMKQKELAAVIGIDCSTLVRLLDALHDAGFIERRSDSDRRVKLIHLTEKGRKTVLKVEDASVAIRGKILSDISDKDLKITLKVLEHICEHLSIICKDAE